MLLEKLVLYYVSANSNTVTKNKRYKKDIIIIYNCYIYADLEIFTDFPEKPVILLQTLLVLVLRCYYLVTIMLLCY